MKRFAPILLVLTGWFIAQVAGTPAQVYAQARTSLSSLQAAIDNIINGNTTVGFSTQSDFAIFAFEAEVATSVPIVSDGDITSTQAGQLRYNAVEGTLQVSDGTSWRSLAYEIVP